MRACTALHRFSHVLSSCQALSQSLAQFRIVSVRFTWESEGSCLCNYKGYWDGRETVGSAAHAFEYARSHIQLTQASLSMHLQPLPLAFSSINLIMSNDSSMWCETSSWSSLIYIQVKASSSSVWSPIVESVQMAALWKSSVPPTTSTCHSLACIIYQDTEDVCVCVSLENQPHLTA